MLAIKTWQMSWTWHLDVYSFPSRLLSPFCNIKLFQLWLLLCYKFQTHLGKMIKSWNGAFLSIELHYSCRMQTLLRFRRAILRRQTRFHGRLKGHVIIPTRLISKSQKEIHEELVWTTIQSTDDSVPSFCFWKLKLVLCVLACNSSTKHP